MPKEYERIRDSYVRRGTPLKKAKKLAAMTYNSQHPGHPMHPHRKSRMPKRDKHGYY